MTLAVRRGPLLPLLTGTVAFLILVGLGTWQLQRLAWKETLIARVEARVHAPPVPLARRADWPALTRAGDEYRHVRLAGTFDHGRETLVYTVRGEDAPPPRGQGYFVITPLMRADGPPVLVNRGFVPKERADPASRRAGEVEGTVEVTGLLRFSEEPSLFVPANDPAHNAFYRVNVADISMARGLGDAAPFLIDADATPTPSGLPVGGTTRISFPNRHLEYALTWFGLAAALVGVGAAVAWSRRRQSPTA